MRFIINKFVLLMIIYFAGFATAIYALAPAPQNCENEKNVIHSFVKSDAFAQRFNHGLHKCLDMSRQTAYRLEEFVSGSISENLSAREKDQPDDS